MAVKRHRRREARWIFGVVTGLLLALTPLMGVWPEGKALNTGHTRQRALEKRPYVVVRQGQLSVNVREADLGEVLAEIGRQAGIRMVLGPSPGERISAQFSGVELETGLRRLLRLASLNYIILYAPESAGRCASTGSLTSCLKDMIRNAPDSARRSVIQEVRVFGEKKEETPPPPQPIVAEGEVEESGSNPGNPFHKLFEQARATGLLSPEWEQRQAARRDQHEATRHLPAVFRPAKEHSEALPTSTNPGDDPAQQREERGGATESSR
jgi:hypothetical protein